MNHPDKGAKVSTSPSGDLVGKPDEVTSIVVKDKNNNPVGLFEKWNSEAWIYSAFDDLKNLN